ncbi:twin-arginine translocation signal domain-containing protein [Halalkalicoccus salilacus]|uniref:twin-arginine translocation signal domain-containing protein n=1 Tax=Halalkalicoccus salilacus TaxID=3117459 RepID=UPI00300F6FD3
MTDQNPSERTRRTFMKGAAATGVAATGITAFSGNVAAQELQVDADRLNVNQNTGRLSGLVVLNNVNVDVIDDITLENIDVDIIDENNEILSNITVQRLIVTGGGDVVRLIINDVIDDVNILNDANVSLQVNVLSEGGGVLQTATDSLDL